MQHQLYKRSVRIYFRFLPRNWVASQPDLTTWQRHIKAYSEAWLVGHRGCILLGHKKVLC
jgi:hypothetical protein